MTARYDDYLGTFVETLRGISATEANGVPIAIDEAISRTHALLRTAAAGPNKVMFVGNGGSAGIAGHMAIDFAKNGGIRAVTFNDPSSLTCLANDLGYEEVFAKQVEMQGLPGDILIAISSSGGSQNILRAADMAVSKECAVLTFSGFATDNALRQKGIINFYVDSSVYGYVETGHQVILHAILDIGMGWTRARAHVQPRAQLI